MAESINDTGYRNNKAMKLLQFLSKNIIKIEPMWTDDFIHYYSITEANEKITQPNESGRLEYKDTIYCANSINPRATYIGGSWYMTPYLKINLAPLQDSVKTREFVSLFRYLMPINCSIYEIKSNFYEEKNINTTFTENYQAEFSSIVEI